MAGLPLSTGLDLALRGGLGVVLLGLAALLLRDHARSTAARLGAFFALGVVAFTVCAVPGISLRNAPWAAPLLALAAANNLVFWLFARALFDDGFRPRAWHAALWALIAALGVIDGWGLYPYGSAASQVIAAALALEALAFAVWAAAQTIASWSADLVEPRRRLRVAIVVSCGGFIAATALGNLLSVGQRGLAQTAILAAITGTVAWSLLRIGASGELFSSVSEAGKPIRPAAPLEPADHRLAAALDHAIDVDRVYRQEGLTIGQLAQRLQVPEHRLRRMINGALGQRNFASFLNRYRIAEAKAALADPEQAAVPILTIALDAGFNSLGPFNRAFKAETGVTPTVFRREALANPGRFSKSA